MLQRFVAKIFFQTGFCPFVLNFERNEEIRQIIDDMAQLIITGFLTTFVEIEKLVIYTYFSFENIFKSCRSFITCPIKSLAEMRDINACLTCKSQGTFVS